VFLHLFWIDSTLLVNYLISAIATWRILRRMNPVAAMVWMVWVWAFL
jgi:hypothetical protein